MTDQTQPGAVRSDRRNSMQATPNTQHALALGYLGLRRMIGLIGILLPIVLIVGRMIFESPGIKDSISVYYYSVMRDVFVGSLWAIAVFLFSYRYDSWDDILGDVACVAAIGVAIFPTAPPAPMKATEQQVMIGWAHALFAVCFFITLALFALWLFRKTGPDGPTPKKRLRNKVYFVCGSTIVFCLVLIVLVQTLFLPRNPWLQALNPVLWLESLAIWAFGIAWFVKGETILKDDASSADRVINQHAVGKLQSS